MIILYKCTLRCIIVLHILIIFLYLKLWSHNQKTALKEVDLDFQIVGKGSYSPTENILCSDALHQPTRIYEIQDSKKRVQKAT